MKAGSGQAHNPDGGPTRFQVGRGSRYRPRRLQAATDLKPGHVKVIGMEFEAAIHVDDPSAEPCQQTLTDPVRNPPTPRGPTMTTK